MECAKQDLTLMNETRPDPHEHMTMHKQLHHGSERPVMAIVSINRHNTPSSHMIPNHYHTNKTRN